MWVGVNGTECKLRFFPLVNEEEGAGRAGREQPRPGEISIV